MSDFNRVATCRGKGQGNLNFFKVKEFCKLSGKFGIFSSPELFGTQGELLWDGHDQLSIRRTHFSKISETTRPIKAKFYMKHLYEGGTNVFINNSGHLTKMAAMPIYGKNPSKFFFSGTTGPISTKLGMKHRGLKYMYYNVFINYDLWMTLAYFTVRST